MTQEITQLYGDEPDPVGDDEVLALQEFGLSKREARLLLRILLGRRMYELGLGIAADLQDVMDGPLGETVLEEMELYIRPLSCAERREFEALARRLDDLTEAETAAACAANGAASAHRGPRTTLVCRTT